MRKVWVLLTALTMATGSALGHGGRLDTNGGHNHRKLETYHFHRGPLAGESFGSKSEAVATLKEYEGAEAEVEEDVGDEVSLPRDDIAPSGAPGELAGAPILPVGRVIDGDTVELDTQRGPVKVRLIGVDTPETVHPQKPVERFGHEASDYLKKLLAGESVYVVLGEDSTDRYGRALAYLYRASDGLFLNAEIVRQGYGHAYTQFPFEYMEEFRGYERNAREAGRGLWGLGEAAEDSVQFPGVEHGRIQTAGDTNVVGTRAVPSRVIAPSTPNAPNITVYLTRTGKRYHRLGCRYLSKSRIQATLEKAKLRATACKVCQPPR